MSIVNALSIDLEDWYHPELVRTYVSGEEIFSQIEDSSGPILELLAKYNIQATFFILGQVAQQAPALINRIYREGHEIASHGMSHRPLWELNAESLARELDDFTEVIGGIINEPVKIKGFRAPSFSLDDSTKWALEVLGKKGYIYDSSIFPMKNKLYGLNGASLEIYRPSPVDLRRHDSDFKLLEFPLAICDVFGFRVPVAGGFYFRLMPLSLLKGCLKKINETRPFVFYFHPWEICDRTPRVKGLSAADYFITYYGIGSTLRKLEDILKSFLFKPVCEVLGV
jgi:polysaccharide deacetylase family protein (PEP-CTERM system associated)